MSNQTRAEQRPPLLHPPISAALWAEIQRTARPKRTVKHQPARAPASRGNQPKETPARQSASNPTRPAPFSSNPQPSKPATEPRFSGFDRFAGRASTPPAPAPRKFPVPPPGAGRFSGRQSGGASPTPPAPSENDLPKNPAAIEQPAAVEQPQVNNQPVETNAQARENQEPVKIQPEAKDQQKAVEHVTPAEKQSSISQSSQPANPQPEDQKQPERPVPSQPSPVKPFMIRPNGTTENRQGSGSENRTMHGPLNGAAKGSDAASAAEQKPNNLIPNRRSPATFSAWSKSSVPFQIPMEPAGQVQNPRPYGKPNPAEPIQPGPAVNRAWLGLERLLKQHPDLPMQTAVLGVCEDGLPVLLDLNDPTPGALAIISDEREAQMDMLRTAVASLALRNSPSAVQYLVISCQPDLWQSWAKERKFERFCLGVVHADNEEQVRDWILRLADWTEQRRLGQRSGPPVLLILDTVSFLPRLPYDVRLNFDWMAKEGPAAHIWPISAISSELATALGSRILRAFQSRVMGYAADPAVYMRFAGLDEADAVEFGQRGQFAIQMGEDWLRFRLPGG